MASDLLHPTRLSVPAGGPAACGRMDGSPVVVVDAAVIAARPAG